MLSKPAASPRERLLRVASRRRNRQLQVLRSYVDKRARMIQRQFELRVAEAMLLPGEPQ